MQRLAVLLLPLSMLAACELQPAPRKSAAPHGERAPTPPPQRPAPAPVAAVDAGVPPPTFTARCAEVGTHIAAVIIASATDPGARSIYEQDREKMARATAEACTQQGWSEPAAKCYLAATTAAALKACEKKFPPPAAPARPATPTEPQTRDAGAGAGAGSAAPARARGTGAGSAAPARPGAGEGSAAPARPARPRAGVGSAAPSRPAAGAGRPARPAAGSGSAPPRQPGAGTGSAAPAQRRP